MNRRRFVEAAVSCCLLPHALFAAPADPRGRQWAAPDAVFHDDRFPQARELAAALAGTNSLTPVQGDITGLWRSGLGSICRQSALTLHGVTTESFYFCLKLMVAESARIETQVTRIDRDLFLWTLRSRPILSRSLAA